MNYDGSFRIAQDPENKDITIKYNEFFDFCDANNQYKMLSILNDY
jgi:hypothetical protein